MGSKSSRAASSVRKGSLLAVRRPSLRIRLKSVPFGKYSITKYKVEREANAVYRCATPAATNNPHT
eukprot:425048-Pyramimonas_sp.AAC.1